LVGSQIRLSLPRDIAKRRWHHEVVVHVGVAGTSGDGGMARIKVLVEVESRPSHGFEAFEEAVVSEQSAFLAAAAALDMVAGLGVEVDEPLAPVPMFEIMKPRARTPERTFEPAPELREFATPETSTDLPASSMVIPAEVERTRLDDLRAREGVRLWANSPLELYADDEAEVFDIARSRPGLDCRPFRAAVDVNVVRTMLGVHQAWNDGFRGQNVVVGIIDEGINGDVYPVVGGFARPGAQQPGAAPIASHGSMCAADVLVAAPSARLYDYPFLGVANSGGALTMFQALLDQRRVDGTPHLASNSYGFVAVPPKANFPEHEIHDINHPLHRKVREVVVSGGACFFAAGNCGSDCPSGNCHPSGIGPGQSIHGSSSLAEVIAVAAVNTRHERIGYSSQGPGMFVREKPDLAAYSHFFGNFGPGRPGGNTTSPFDSGTSAATPVAAGVAALLLSAFPGLTPGELRNILFEGLHNVTGKPWDPGYGRGVVSAAASYALQLRK
jgi:serine protease AprX